MKAQPGPNPVLTVHEKESGLRQRNRENSGNYVNSASWAVGGAKAPWQYAKRGMQKEYQILLTGHFEV